MGHDAGPEPRRIDVRAELVDHAGDLATRRHREVRRREGPGLAASDGRVEEVDAGRRDGHAHLLRAGMEIGDDLRAQDVGGTELVLTDRLHGPDGTTSSSLEVKTSLWAADGDGLPSPVCS